MEVLENQDIKSKPKHLKKNNLHMINIIKYAIIFFLVLALMQYGPELLRKTINILKK